MNKIITYNGNGNANVEQDVKFTLKLSPDLNKKVVAKASELGISKLSYIRMILSKSVN